MTRRRLTWQKKALNLPVGDRNLPLEVDPLHDPVRTGPLIGKMIEVSPLAGGLLTGRSGEQAKVTGTISRLGQTVGYEVHIGGSVIIGTSKDFYVDRHLIEDIQTPTPTSAGVKEALIHWSETRTYWHERIDGLEALCFELASVTPRLIPEDYPWGWRFLIPGIPGHYTVVDCRTILHGNYWTMSVSIYPETGTFPGDPRILDDHWTRVFSWTNHVARQMIKHGFPWERSVAGLQVRARATSLLLRPLVDRTLNRVLEARMNQAGEVPNFRAGSLSSAFCSLRLKAGTIGLVEPPTDRRAYTIMSVSPGAAKSRGYLEQVVLHECLHLAVASNGKDPHNSEFIELADQLGLKPEYRD